MNTEPTSLRLDTEAKKMAYPILEKIGLKPAQAINLFLRQVALNKGLPFDVKIPNTETIEAIQEIENGGGTKYKSSDEMFEDLEI